MRFIQALRNRTKLLIFAAALVGFGLHASSALAQTSEGDDGNFTTYTYASGGGGSISASGSYPTPDAGLNYASYGVLGVTWSLTGDNYSASGSGSSFSVNSLPPGIYNATFSWSVQYYFYGYTEGGAFSCDLCDAYDEPSATVTLSSQ